MKHGFRLVGLLASLLVCPFRSFGDGAKETTTYDNPGHGFCITLPAGWDLMPKDRLDALNENAATTNPNWPKPVLQYGYQHKESGDFVFAPFILIRVTPLDHEPSPEFTKAELMRDKMAGVDLSEPTFEADLQA